ncbi:MAG TPA: chalcone isomerase family protein [Thermoanaerobaculia bacterium]|nr:chalcone isomerase family protein [Thermoanaerobaculia bacterium]
MRSLTTKSVLTLAFLVATAASAATLAGVKLDDTASAGGQALVLNGAAIRKKLFIKVYVAALYLPAKQSNPAAILGGDTPRRMVMHFVFSVGKEKIAEAWQEGLAANVPNASADVKTNFATLSSWMDDMKDGQQLSLTYVPGTGTTIEVNGKVKGTLAGKATADAILSTWIGPKPGPGEDFKNGVLGK